MEYQSYLSIHIPKYLYNPLPIKNKQSIRLVHLNPSPEGCINCSLVVTDLDDNPSYTALSYTWGDPGWTTSRELPSSASNTIDGPRNFILCSGKSLQVTKNLFDLLIQLRERGFRDAIWIDAICINQADVNERDSQVSIMGRIYNTAENVLVWLGRGTEGTEETLQLVQRIADIPPAYYDTVKTDPAIYGVSDPEGNARLGSGLVTVPTITHVEMKVLAPLMLSQWFTRCWVVQEFALAPKTVILWDRHEIVWDHILSVSDFMLTINWSELAEKYVKDPRNVRELSTFCQLPSDLEALRIEIRKSGHMPLYNCLRISRNFNATDPRDKVYAFLGLLDASTRALITPNYREMVEKTYTRAAVAVIMESGNLQLLANLEDMSQRNLHSLPSWVPDLTCAGMFSTFGFFQRFDAVRGQRLDPVTTTRLESHSILQLKGVQVDCVSTIADSDDNWLYPGHGCTASFGLMIDQHRIGSRYPRTQQSLIEVLWGVLITDMGPTNQSPAPLSHSSLFKHYLIAHHPGIENLGGETAASEVLKSIEALTILALTFSNDDDRTSETLPSLDEIVSFQGGLESEEKRQRIRRDAEDFQQTLQATMWLRRLFRTEQNLLGIAAKSIKPGDGIWLVPGSRVPLILRKLSNGHYIFVGEAYLHGIMNGEAMVAEARFEDITVD
jgi:hypothetical protein